MFICQKIHANDTEAFAKHFTILLQNKSPVFTDLRFVCIKLKDFKNDDKKFPFY